MPTTDPTAIAAHVYGVVFENDRVRVLDVRMRPGTRTELHTHPDSVWVVRDAIRARFTAADGSAFEGDIPAGAMWRPAELHAAENLGANDIVAIAIELK